MQIISIPAALTRGAKKRTMQWAITVSVVQAGFHQSYSVLAHRFSHSFHTFPMESFLKERVT